MCKHEHLRVRQLETKGSSGYSYDVILCEDCGVIAGVHAKENIGSSLAAIGSALGKIGGILKDISAKT